MQANITHDTAPPVLAPCKSATHTTHCHVFATRVPAARRLPEDFTNSTDLALVSSLIDRAAVEATPAAAAAAAAAVPVAASDAAALPVEEKGELAGKVPAAVRPKRKRKPTLLGRADKLAP